MELFRALRREGQRVIERGLCSYSAHSSPADLSGLPDHKSRGGKQLMSGWRCSEEQGGLPHRHPLRAKDDDK